jgi:hypothetical protein
MILLKDADVMPIFISNLRTATDHISDHLQKVCARAEYHFDTSLRYMDDAATVSSGSSGEKQSFNLSKWRSGYAQTHPSVLARMFFA